MVEVYGYDATLKYLERYNTVVPIERIKDSLDADIKRMENEVHITSISTCGYLLVRTTKNDLDVWVRPDLWLDNRRE
jgi:hypothetical protein